MSSALQHVVFHRHHPKNRVRPDFFSAPLLLWLPEGSAYSVNDVTERALGSSSTSKELLVGHGSRLWAHIHTVLQPFREGQGKGL